MPFGKGIYLTDSFSKAAKESCTQKDESPDGKHYGIVFAVEAALGEMYKAYEPDQFKNGLPAYYHSVYGVG